MVILMISSILGRCSKMCLDVSALQTKNKQTKNTYISSFVAKDALKLHEVELRV